MWSGVTTSNMSIKDTQNFEKGRIKALQDERVYIQKKTFTKWANAFLEKVSKQFLLKPLKPQQTKICGPVDVHVYTDEPSLLFFFFFCLFFLILSYFV